MFDDLIIEVLYVVPCPAAFRTLSGARFDGHSENNTMQPAVDSETLDNVMPDNHYEPKAGLEGEIISRFLKHLQRTYNKHPKQYLLIILVNISRSVRQPQWLPAIRYMQRNIDRHRW